MLFKPNHDLRIYAATSGVHLWEVAQAYGTTYNTLNIWMRKEFDKDKKDEFREKVDSIASKGA